MERIPFEPVKKKKKATKPEAKSDNMAKPRSSPAQKPLKPVPKVKPSAQTFSKDIDKNSVKKSVKKTDRDSGNIPKVVSDRMVRRSVLFCGIPTGLGFIVLIASYLVISKHLFEIPNALVLLGSLGFTGIGVLGLSYGALSASWDEHRLGSWLGAAEFQKNLSYLSAAWKNQSSLQKPSSDTD